MGSGDQTQVLVNEHQALLPTEPPLQPSLCFSDSTSSFLLASAAPSSYDSLGVTDRPVTKILALVYHSNRAEWDTASFCNFSTSVRVQEIPRVPFNTVKVLSPQTVEMSCRIGWRKEHKEEVGGGTQKKRGKMEERRRWKEGRQERFLDIVTPRWVFVWPFAYRWTDPTNIPVWHHKII